jgi:CheY-like chemotaxis protein
MGLSVINRIMHENHGHIIVESKAGEGSSFRLLFPLESQREKVATGTVDAQLYKPSVSTTGNILIIDDDQSVGQFIGELLLDRGFRATVMNDSQAAVALFKSDIEKFDLVLTDQSMPELTGTELAQELHSLRPDLPIIIMTGYSDDINEEKATRLGIRGFMTKPLESSQLIQMITRLATEN